MVLDILNFDLFTILYFLSKFLQKFTFRKLNLLHIVTSYSTRILLLLLVSVVTTTTSLSMVWFATSSIGSFSMTVASSALAISSLSFVHHLRMSHLLLVVWIHARLLLLLLSIHWLLIKIHPHLMLRQVRLLLTTHILLVRWNHLVLHTIASFKRLVHLVSPLHVIALIVVHVQIIGCSPMHWLATLHTSPLLLRILILLLLLLLVLLLLLLLLLRLLIVLLLLLRISSSLIACL